MDSSFYDFNKFKTDNIRAVDAKFEAQKIAFAPLAFQAIKAMLNLGIMQAISDAGDEGISRKELAQKTGVSEYGAGVLCEMALGMNVIKVTKESQTMELGELLSKLQKILNLTQKPKNLFLEKLAGCFWKTT